LNPAGSAFCAFCGAAIASAAPAATDTATAVTGPVGTPAALDSEPVGVEPVSEPQRELPSWLYEQASGRSATAATTPAGPPTATAELKPGQSKYLNDIPGALPRTEGWLSAATKPEMPAGSESPQSKPKGQAGCLTLVLAVLLAVAALLLVVG